MAATSKQQERGLAADLMRRCAHGDYEALAELQTLLSRQILWVARRILFSHEEAEEVLQEVMLYLWQHADRYDATRSSVPTWVSMIARSRAIDRLRRADTAQRTRKRLALETESSIDSSSESEILTRQRRLRLARALRTLPSKQRRAVELAYYGEKTQAQIARETQIPLGTVKTRLYLAMGKLRNELGAEAAELL